MSASASAPCQGKSGILWRGASTLVACVLIAVMLAVVGGARLSYALVYSLSIGTLCWAAVDGGRELAARLVFRARPSHPGAARGWPGWPAMSAVIVLGTALAYVAGSWLGDLLTGQQAQALKGGWRGLVLMLLISLVVASVITGVFYARQQLAQAREQAADALRLAAVGQLGMLQAQLEPHMLFNTLANLRVLIELDPPRAQAMLDRLIAYLRTTLNASRSPTHALAAEFEGSADYLALMGMRMGPCLQVALTLPDELRALQVPPLLLQPLVENAIKHGLEPKVGGGRIAVSARRQQARLVLEVRDTGVGMQALPRADGGFGINQVRERLATLYGEQARFELRNAGDAEGGALARIVLPLPASAT